MANYIYHMIYDGTQWQILNPPTGLYGECTTAVGTAAKTANIPGFVLYPGAEVYIKFTKNNTHLTPTLNINGIGAKAIRNRNATSGTFYYVFLPNHYYHFIYNGTDFVVANHIIQEAVTLGVTAVAEVTDPDTGEVTTPAVAQVHGKDVLSLGNVTTSTTNSGLTGVLGLYNAGTKVIYISPELNTAANDRTWYLPNLNSNRYFVTHSAATALGSNTQPLKLDANGALATCSTYAGGTAVTLNNSSKAASTASFYAPTAGGAAGKVLIGAGTTTMPAWTAAATLTSATSTTANTAAYTDLTLGNTANVSTTTAHSEGRIFLYSAATKYHQISGTSTTTNYIHYLPNNTGWVATGGNGTSTGVGSLTQPVYLNTSGVIKESTSIVDIVYPIGSIYISVNSANPGGTSGVFPGTTWAEFGKGRMLIGVDSSDSNMNTAEETGGEKTHTLTENELPVITRNSVFRNFHASTTGSTYGTMSQTGTDGTVDTNYSVDFVHIVFSQSYSTNQTATRYTMTFGDGQAHNNLPPYIAVYMWKRTA